MLDLKTLISHSKFILPILTLLSLSKQVLYYYLFNIKIGYYIGIEEVLTPFMSDLLYYFLTLILPVFTLTLFFGTSIAQKNLQSFKDEQNQPFSHRLWNDLKTYWIFWIIQIVLLTALIVKHKPIETILSTATFIPLMYVIFWIRKEALIKTDFKFTAENTTFYNLSTILIVVFLLTISSTFSDVSQIKYEKNKTVVIELDSKTITCSDSLVYIGRTKSNSFIYDRKLKETSIIDNSSIKKIIVKE